MINSTTASLTVECSTFIKAHIHKVFQTLTTPQGWNAWFTKEMFIEPRKGGKIEFVWRDWGANHVDIEDGGTITAFEPNSKFAFTWHSDTSPTTVTFNLRQLGNGTLVNLTDAGYKLEQITDQSGFADCCCGWGEALTLLKFYCEYGIVFGTVPRD